MKATKVGTAVILLICSGAIAPRARAIAQEQPTVGLEEIVVTALHVAETLQNAPVSITAFSTSDLQVRGVKDLTDLTNFVPNLNFLSSTGQSSSSAAFVFIRGVGETNPFLENDPGVGVYVDGVYIGRTQGGVFDTLDLLRVEVLRGPQGTLYGRNTIGGAINLISNPPDGKLAITGGVEGGNYGTINSHLKINVPLSDRLFASLAVVEKKHDGYVEPINSPDCPICNSSALSNEKDVAARGALRWLASDALTFDLSADYSVKHNLPIGVRLLSYNDGLFGPPIPPGTVIPPFPPGFPFCNYEQCVTHALGHDPSYFVNGQSNTSQSNFAGEDHQRVWGTNLTATWSMNGFTFKSISAYRALHITDSNDGDGSPVGLFSNNYDQIRQDQESQEFQIMSTAFGRLDWQAGLYGYKENATESQDFSIYQEGGAFGPFPCFAYMPGPPSAAAGCGDNGAQYSNYAVVSAAAYGNGTYHITDSFSASAGVRFSYDRKTFYYTQAGEPAEFTDDAKSWNAVTPRVGAEYRIDKQALLYASYSQGFKSGAFNNGTFTAAGGSRAVAPEKVKSYELGAKTKWLDDRASLNAAVFYSDYTDQQLQITPELGPPGQHAFVNAGASRIYGAELELNYRPSSDLLLNASAGYTHTKIAEVAPGTRGVTVGSKLPFTPNVTANLGAQWTIPWQIPGSTELRGDWSYIGPQNGDALNTATLITPGRSVTDFRLTYRPPFAASESGWEFYGWVKNAFDRQYRTATYSAFAPQFVVGIDGPPRTYGGGFNFHF